MTNIEAGVFEMTYVVIKSHVEVKEDQCLLIIICGWQLVGRCNDQGPRSLHQVA